MTAGFSLRKIQRKKTLGEKLRQARKKKKVSLLDAEIETKIRAKYLEALENDDWKNMPADAYTKGFVIRYARFLGLSEEKTLSEYKKERSFFTKNIDSYLVPEKNFKPSKFVITPKFFIAAAATLFLITIFSYIAYQVYGFAAAPDLAISSPENNSIVDLQTIEVKGLASQNSNVTLNSEPIYVSETGEFSADLKLQKGINVIRVQAKNRADKEKTVTYTIEYKPQTAATNLTTAEN